jgi:hypothetical protein
MRRTTLGLALLALVAMAAPAKAGQIQQSRQGTICYENGDWSLTFEPQDGLVGEGCTITGTELMAAANPITAR